MSGEAPGVCVQTKSLASRATFLLRAGSSSAHGSAPTPAVSSASVPIRLKWRSLALAPEPSAAVQSMLIVAASFQ